MNIAIIVAAGNSSRFNLSTPKQYCLLHNKLVVEYSLKIFAENNLIDKIILVVAKNHNNYSASLKDKYKLDAIIEGGKTRQESVKNALNYAQKYQPQTVLIHDAARPFLNDEIITNAFSSLSDYAGAVPVLALNDSIRRIAKEDNIALNRAELYNVQTPQIFSFAVLHKCHNLAKKNNYSDDASLIEDFNYKINVFNGCRKNFKITYYDDLTKAEYMLQKKFNYKIGNGFDVHKFTNISKNSYIFLGGIKIKHDYSLIAHSDGDVLLHSLVDAMLGAVAAGDIGDHFPPSDAKYKNMPSTLFVLKAKEIMAKKNARIINIDSTIICEQPKLTNYKLKIAKNLANILGIDLTNISIKATTTEKLGFLGRGEAIAATTTIMVKQYE